MVAPVNVLRFSYEPKATLGRHWKIFIDRSDLTEVLERSFPKRYWQDKNRVLVNVEEIRKSAESSGRFSILVCANCAASGYQTCNDVGLESFEVVHEDNAVHWRIEIVDWLSENAQEHPIRFRFHKPQYQKEIELLPKS